MVNIRINCALTQSHMIPFVVVFSYKLLYSFLRYFSESTDVYSYGVLLWEMYNRGAVPYGSRISDNEVRSTYNTTSCRNSQSSIPIRSYESLAHTVSRRSKGFCRARVSLPRTSVLLLCGQQYSSPPQRVLYHSFFLQDCVFSTYKLSAVFLLAAYSSRRAIFS